MGNPNRVAGQAVIKVDGDTFETDGNSTMELGGSVRSAVEGDYQAGSFRETTTPSKIEMSVLLKGGTRIADLRKIDNGTVTLQTDVGQTYLMRNAYCADVISFSTNEGKARLVFMGPPAEELV